MNSESATNKIDVVFHQGIYTESPRWQNGALWFSDIGASNIYRVTADGKQELIHSGIPAPSGLGWMANGDLLVASLTDSTIYRIGSDKKQHVFAGPEQHGTHGTNDMATRGSRSYVTCSGREYQMGDDYETLAQALGTILLLDHDTGETRIVADGLKMPNGVGITRDGRALIVAELFASRLLRFDIRPDGSLSEPAIFVQLDHMIDGLCLDAEDGVWIGTTADYFQRFDAAGNKAESIQVPDWSCIACALGGPAGNNIFMAVCQMDTPDAIFEGRSKGRILSSDVKVPAAP
jgi:sugar lactone lactonase YvrE